MRLSLVTETFPPEVNGVAMTLGRWVDAFRTKGHAVRVLRPQRRGENRTDGVFPAMPLPFYKEVRVGLAYPSTVAGCLRRARTDLVHVATEGPLGLSALVAARRLKVPVVTSFHTNFDRYTGHYGFGAIERLAVGYLRRFHNAARLTLVPSEGTRRRLEGLGFARLAIWSRGVDGGRFHPRFRDDGLRASLGLGAGDILLLYVGRLAPEKNLPLLLTAFARLRERWKGREKIRLALVGGGPLMEGLRRNQPADVILAGLRHGEDLARWYASSDLFCFPSCTETFGNVVLEAMASGLPVLAFDCPGVNEQFRDGVEGLLLDREGNMAAGMDVLCRDGGRRAGMGHAARKAAEKRDWGNVFDTLERQYREILAAPAVSS